MFANVAVVGIQTLAKVDLRDNRNAVIVSTSIGMALLVTLKPGIVSVMPSWLQIIFGSGVTIGSLTAIILNLLFFHIGRQASPDVAVVNGKKINLDDVNAMDRATFVSTFSQMFTSQTWPAERAWEARPFASVSELRSSFEDAVLAATPQEAEELIASYDDIVSLVLDGQGDDQSLADTSNLSVGELTDKEAEELRATAEKNQLPATEAADVRVSEPTATLKAGAEERAATSSGPTTYAVKKPAAGTASKPAATATKAKKSAANRSAGDEAARALGRGLNSMGKMFGSFKDEFDKASK